jgi:hypothetical protein
LRIDFVDLLMGSFVLHPAAYAVVATTLASIPVAAVEVSGSASRSATVCTVEVTALPVSKARLLAFGNYRAPPASQNVEAQRFFDRGLVFGRGFSFAEAGRSFRAAAQLDPKCSLCRWGIAWALGPSINHHAAEARKVFSADLQIYPGNCVALAGLTAAERKQRSSLSASFDSSAQTSARLSHCPE